MTSRKTVKVDVFIPVYNGSLYIGECIESVLVQTYKDFRLVVSDNCSTDDTEGIVRSFGDSRITYLRNEHNLGLVGNENRCLDLAESEYVYILHHDDIMLPENLERKVQLMDENPGLGFVHSNIYMIDAGGQIIRQWKRNEDPVADGGGTFERYVLKMHLGASVFIGAVLARKRCYEHLGRFRTELPHCQDSEMWMRMSLFYDVGFVAEPLVKWRQHSASASSEWGAGLAWLEEHYLATCIIFEQYGDQIPNLRTLRRRVEKNFAYDALSRGLEAYRHGDFGTSSQYLKLAEKFSHYYFLLRDYWNLRWRLQRGSQIRKGLSAGPEGGGL